MIILGIQEAHDASCCIMKDGEIIAAAQEERFTGLKGDYGLPLNAIRACLKEVNLTTRQIDKVALASKNWNPVLTKIKRNANFSVQDWVDEQNYYWLPKILKNQNRNYYDLYKNRSDFVYDNIYDMDHLLQGYMDSNEMQRMQQVRIYTVSKLLGINKDKIQLVTHEDCHKYYAWLGSHLNNQLVNIITSEGIGDYSNGTVSTYGYNRLNIEHQYMIENHIGHLYQYITLLLGMKPAQHEYKVMGLAPYANEFETEKCYNIIKNILKVDGLEIKFDQKPPDFYRFFREALEGCRFDGIAGGIQKMTEDLLVKLTENIVDRLNIGSGICFAGGVAQNIKACKKMSEVEGVNDFSVMPAAGDTSISIGACYYVNYMNINKSKPIDNIYLGPSFDKLEVRKARRYWSGLVYDYTPKNIALLLVKGKVIGRCYGRMEFGHRALGNRSILADPRDINIVNKLNQKIKYRDWWMPFTPTILAERADDYISNHKKLKCPYMTIAFDSTELARKEIPAALHSADYTIRPQILTRKQNPEYYDIIKEFEKLTGVGAILNTSFNLHGKPIVLGPKEAFDTFINSGLDCLILNDLLIKK